MLIRNTFQSNVVILANGFYFYQLILIIFMFWFYQWNLVSLNFKDYKKTFNYKKFELSKLI